MHLNKLNRNKNWCKVTTSFWRIRCWNSTLCKTYSFVCKNEVL